MKGILMTPAVWAAKKRVLDAGGPGQTRRLIKFPKFDNVIDSDWHAPWFNDNLGKWVFTARFGMSTRGAWVKPRYLPGEVVYVKEACWFDGNTVVYKSDPGAEETRTFIFGGYHWRSPLFMPARAARYFFQIADVRPERLQDITEEDCIAEGFLTSPACADIKVTGRQWYRMLWDSINKPPHGWSSNPWIWEYCFKLTDRPEV